MLKGIKLLCLLWLSFSLFSCGDLQENDRTPPSKGTWVSPSVDSRGRVRKGHYRRPVSTSKNAVKNQARSRYYYQTRGKYKRKKD